MSYIPNNKFPGNPGIMCDGRLFTDYRSASVANQELMEKINKNNRTMKSKIFNNDNYRRHLTKNASNIIEDNFNKSFENTKCRNCHSDKRFRTPKNKIEDPLEIVARPKNLI